MKNKNLIIFGLGDMARLAFHYFSTDSEYRVIAFSISKHLMETKQKTFYNLPIIPFEDIQAIFPPDENDMFIAMGYKNLNKDRAKFYYEAKEKKYNLPTYISSHAVVLSMNIGDNCFIFENNIIQPFVKVGNNVILWSGGVISHDSKIDDHCFLAPRVAIAGRSHVGKYCFIGINAIIIDHVTIEENCIIGAGSLIKHHTKAGEVYMGESSTCIPVPSHKISLSRERKKILT